MKEKVVEVSSEKEAGGSRGWCLSDAGLHGQKGVGGGHVIWDVLRRERELSGDAAKV